MISYGYERVSSREQRLDRQDTAIKNYRPEIPETNIFRDKQTGKDFDRAHYNAMKIILEHVSKVNDSKEIVEVIFEELDRLGRNKEGIKKELEWFKNHGIVVRILEIPTTLCDISLENKWVMELVTQILIEVYSSLAEQELEKREKRQREGIEEALKKGVKFGRPAIKINESEFKRVYESWKANSITAVQAMNMLGLKSNTFYRRVAEYEKKVGESNGND
uniref:recombinase family protein n=1 Tax=Acetatifactor sp. TaxID=1872090 RepID=UPI004056E8AF